MSCVEDEQSLGEIGVNIFMIAYYKASLYYEEYYSDLLLINNFSHNSSGYFRGIAKSTIQICILK